MQLYHPTSNWWLWAHTLISSNIFWSPKESMYGIFTYIYHILPLKTTIHVGEYTSPMDLLGVETSILLNSQLRRSHIDGRGPIMVWSSERIESTSAGAYRRSFVGSWAHGSKGKVGEFLGEYPRYIPTYTTYISWMIWWLYRAMWGKCPFKWGNRFFIFNHNQAF